MLISFSAPAPMPFTMVGLCPAACSGVYPPKSCAL
jgi:hypothetical protein